MKRILAIVLAMSIVLPTVNVFSVVADELVYELGDVDKNGKIDVVDAMNCVKFITKNPDTDGYDAGLADVNSDDQITIEDALRIWIYSRDEKEKPSDIIVNEQQLTAYLNSTLNIEKIDETTYKVTVILDKTDVDVFGLELGIYVNNGTIISHNMLYNDILPAVLCRELHDENRVLLMSGIISEKLDKEYRIYEVEIVVDDPNEVPELILFGDSSKYVSSVDDCSVIDIVNYEPTPEPTVTPEVPVTPGPDDYNLGDVDNSEDINAKDALSVLKYAAKLSSTDELSLAAADVDKSGGVDATDALYILQYAAKIIVRFVFTPEENMQILKDYIKENGVADDEGVYIISRDYVAENDSDYNVEVDSISYDSSNDLILYKYDVDFSDESGKYVYSYIIELGASESKIRLVYFKDSNEMYIKWDLVEKVNNSQLNITKFFDIGLNKQINVATLRGSDITNAEREKFKKDNKKFINAMMHSAVLSMEDYLKSTLVMNLKDLGFSSYTYTDEQLYEVFAPLYGIDTDIEDSYEIVKDLIIKYGERDGEEIVISSGFTGGESEPYVDGFESEVYLVYNETEDFIYFSGVIYTDPSGYAVSVVIQPFKDAYSYCGVHLYKPGSENYELIYNVEFIERSYKFKYGANYDYEYVYPENGKMSDMEQAITSYGIGRLLEDVAYELWSKGDDFDLIGKLGFINVR